MRGRKTLEPFFNDKGADPARASRQVCLGIDHQHIGIRAIGDPHLVAVEDVTVPALFGGKLHGNNIGPRARLRHGQRADMLTGNEFRQIFRALFGRTVAGDLVDAEIGMGAVAKADGGGSTADLLHGDAMGEIAHACATIVFRRRNAEYAKLTKFTPKMHGKLIIAVGFSGKRRNAAFGETAHSVTKGFDLLAKTEVHPPSILTQSKHTRPPQVLPGCCFSRTAMSRPECPVAAKYAMVLRGVLWLFIAQ